jgi:hypothetical protein
MDDLSALPLPEEEERGSVQVTEFSIFEFACPTTKGAIKDLGQSYICWIMTAGT